jgi:type IV secretion system protein VirB5
MTVKRSFKNEKIENIAKKIDKFALFIFSPLPIKSNDSLKDCWKITKGDALMYAVIIISGVLAPAPARAMAVFDSVNFGQMVQSVQNGLTQVQQGAQELVGQASQLAELKNQVVNQLQQIQQLKDQLINASGISDIGNLVNQGKQFAEIIPKDLNSLESFANSSSIQASNKIIDLSATSINPTSTAGKLFTKERQQAAVNMAAIQKSYDASYDRLINLQTLIEQIEKSPSAKNIADLSARIQGEQLFLTNETNRLLAMAQMQQSQKDITAQQEIEGRLAASQSKTNHKW